MIEKRNNIFSTIGKNVKISFLLLLCSFVLFLNLYFNICQSIDERTITAVLQYPVDLLKPPSGIFAVTTQDQKLPSGETFLKGTRFLGMISQENEKFIITFNSAQLENGNSLEVNGKAYLNGGEGSSNGGVSAKIGNTFESKTKSTVIGAIFTTPGSAVKISDNVLPRGTVLKIQFN